MRISDGSSDVCSSDLSTQSTVSMRISELEHRFGVALFDRAHRKVRLTSRGEELLGYTERLLQLTSEIQERIARPEMVSGMVRIGVAEVVAQTWLAAFVRSEEHTSELQSLMRISYAVFCLKKKKNKEIVYENTHNKSRQPLSTILTTTH